MVLPENQHLGHLDRGGHVLHTLIIRRPHLGEYFRHLPMNNCEDSIGCTPIYQEGCMQATKNPPKRSYYSYDVIYFHFDSMFNSMPAKAGHP